MVAIKYKPNKLHALSNDKNSPSAPEKIGPKHSPAEITALNKPDAKDIHFSCSDFLNFYSNFSVINGRTKI